MTFTNPNSSLEFLTDAMPGDSASYDRWGDTDQFVLPDLANLKPAFRQRIQYTSAPFLLEFSAVNREFARLKASLPCEPVQQAGTWMTVTTSRIWTFFYQLDLQPGVTVKWKGELLVFCAFNDFKSNKAPRISLHQHRIEEALADEYGDLERNMGLPIPFANLPNLIVFSRYCGWKTLTIPPGKSEPFFDTTYLNNSDFVIEVMDCPDFMR